MVISSFQETKRIIYTEKRRVGRFWLWVKQILNYLKIRIFIIFDSRHLGKVMVIDGMLFFNAKK